MPLPAKRRDFRTSKPGRKVTLLYLIIEKQLVWWICRGFISFHLLLFEYRRKSNNSTSIIVSTINTIVESVGETSKHSSAVTFKCQILLWIRYGISQSNCLFKAFHFSNVRTTSRATLLQSFNLLYLFYILTYVQTELINQGRFPESFQMTSRLTSLLQPHNHRTLPVLWLFSRTYTYYCLLTFYAKCVYLQGGW